MADDIGFESNGVEGQDEGDGVHPMKMFSVTYKWYDKNGIDEHVTQGVVLPSGIDVKEEGAVEARVELNKRETAITVDLSYSLMFDPDAYGREFYQYTAMSYGNAHDKMKSWRSAVAKAQGSSSQNRIKYVHREATAGVSVEKDPIEGEGGKGLRAFLLGKKTNPEAMAHIELIGDKPFHEAVGGCETMPDKQYP